MKTYLCRAALRALRSEHPSSKKARARFGARRRRAYLASLEVPS